MQRTFETLSFSLHVLTSFVMTILIDDLEKKNGAVKKGEQILFIIGLQKIVCFCVSLQNHVTLI